MTGNLMDDSTAYLQAVYEARVPKRSEALVEFLRANSWTPISDREKVELIAVAVAVVALHGENRAFLQPLAAGRTTKRQAPASRLIVETLYDEKEPSTARTRTLSAWSIAVRYLVERAVPPTTIPELALVKGEGIDAWAKAGAKRTRSPTGRHQVKKSKPLEAATVTVEVGSRKKKFSISDHYALRRIVADLERLEKSYTIRK